MKTALRDDGLRCIDRVFEKRILQPSDASSNCWMRTEEAAEYLRTTAGTIRNLTSQGRVPYYKAGRRNLHRKDELDRLLLSQKERSKLMGIKEDKAAGTWEAFYSKRHPITRQPIAMRRKKLRSKAEALRVEKELVLLVERKLHIAVSPTWETCVEEYLRWARSNGNCESTIHAYEKCLRAHTIPVWKERCIDSIMPEDVRQLVQDPTKQWSQSHRKNMVKYVRAVFTYALEAQYLGKVPVPRMKFRVVPDLKGGLTEGQARELLGRAQDTQCDWFPIWALALYTGLRNGELFALRWDCINLEGRLLHVKQTWNKKDGYKPPKSWEERKVELAPPAVALLRELRPQTIEAGFVLPRPDDWPKGEQARVLRMFLMGMGLPFMRLHDLRASWATMLLCKGIEPIKIMAMGGWKDRKTMEKYVRIAGVDIRGITTCLNLHDTAKGPKVVRMFGS